MGSFLSKNRKNGILVFLVFLGLCLTSQLFAGSKVTKRQQQQLNESGVSGPFYCAMNCATVPGGLQSLNALYVQNRNASALIVGGGPSPLMAELDVKKRCNRWCAERMQGALGAYLLDGPVLKCVGYNLRCDRGIQ